MSKDYCGYATFGDQTFPISQIYLDDSRIVFVIDIPYNDWWKLPYSVDIRIWAPDDSLVLCVVNVQMHIEESDQAVQFGANRRGTVHYHQPIIQTSELMMAE